MADRVEKGTKGFLTKVQLERQAEERLAALEKGSAVSGSSSASATESTKRESRICCCTDPGLCSEIQERFFKLGITNRVGYCKVLGSGTSEPDSRFKLYCQQLGIVGSEDSQDQTRSTLQIAFTHFPPAYLDAAWNRSINRRRIDFTIGEADAKKYGFTTRSKKVGWIVSPYYSYEQNMAELSALEAEIQEAAEQ